jgi:acyl-CoA thioester hydrolase
LVFELRALDCWSMSAAVFSHSHRVTYAECTVSDHIYYARYLDLLEAARNEFFRHLGVPFRQWQEQDTIFPVVECHLRYTAPARYDDLLQIDLWVTVAERVRLNFGYGIRNQCRVQLLEAETRHTCTTLAGKVKRLPQSLCAALAPYHIPAPDSRRKGPDRRATPRS